MCFKIIFAAVRRNKHICQRDRFRKPEVGMWEYLERKGNAGVPIDRATCIYIGDAAGAAESCKHCKPI